LIILFLSLFLAACRNAEEPSPSPSVPDNLGVKPVRLTSLQIENGNIENQPVERETVSDTFQVLGEFQSKARSKAVVEASLSGRVEAVLVEEGQNVESGRPLIRLTSPELSRLQAEYHHAQRKLALLETNAGQKIILAEEGPETREPLNRASTRLQQARAQEQAEEAQLKAISLRKERIEKLYESGIPSQEQVEQVNSEYFQALARYQAAQDEVRLAQESFQRESRLDRSETRESIAKQEISAELHLAREEVRHQKELLGLLGKNAEEESPEVLVRAPASGTVTKIFASLGEYVDPGRPLLELVQTGQVYPLVWIPASYIPEVKVDSEATVYFSNDPVGHGARVAWLAPEIDPETRSLAARLLLKDQSTTTRAGVFFKAEVIAGSREALVVPAKAVTEVDGTTCVYVALDDTSFERRQIKPGIRSSESVEVLEGLQEGEKCVTEGVFLVKSHDLGVEGE
jgi:cobalt-zinc-cadmium efflux system membrane fusion protein